MAPGGKWKHGDMNRPRPRVITPPGMSTQAAPGHAPSDAIVLFDGTDLSKWKRDKPTPDGDDKAPWKVEGGYFEVVPKTGYLRTREKIKGDTQWHIEWAAPSEVKGSSQGRGNSGVFIGGFPEVQVLDSFENDTYPDGQAAGLYGNYPPMVNASRKPGEWQTYDIIFEGPRWDEDKKLLKPAYVTVIQNGVLLHHHREFLGETKHRELPAYTPGRVRGPIELQDHGNPTRFRNIWIRKLGEYDKP
jgi:hypothetical protein